MIVCGVCFTFTSVLALKGKQRLCLSNWRLPDTYVRREQVNSLQPQCVNQRCKINTIVLWKSAHSQGPYTFGSISSIKSKLLKWSPTSSMRCYQALGNKCWFETMWCSCLCQRTADEGSRAETSCIIYSAMSLLHQVFVPANSWCSPVISKGFGTALCYTIVCVLADAKLL